MLVRRGGSDRCLVKGGCFEVWDSSYVFILFSSTKFEDYERSILRPGTLVFFYCTKNSTRFEEYEIIYSSDATLVWIVVV